MNRNPIQVVTPPSAEPVTLQELQAQLRLNDATGTDTELNRAIVAARELFELQTGRAVLPTTLRQFADCWGDGVPLQVGPVTSVTSVQYYDTADTIQTLTGTQIDNAGIPALLYLPSGNYPALSTRIRRPIRITFVAGWGSVNVVPSMVKVAILQMAANYYEFRLAHGEEVLTPTPEGWDRVVALHRTGLEFAS